MKDTMDLEVILEEMGAFGRYQIQVYLYLAVTIIFSAVYNCQYVFAAGQIAYRCRVPECESTPVKFETNGWGKFALPAPGPNGADCYRHHVVGKTCDAASFTNASEPCSSWVYENHDTIVAEFNLACKEWMRTLVGTVHGAGVLFAQPLTAVVSDTFGRKHALVATSVAPAIVGVLRAYCNNYVIYLILEFLEALVGAGTYSTAFILALEIVGLKMRVLGGNVISSMFATGQMLAAVAAWCIPYWRTYTLVIFFPSFLFAFYWFFVEESVRWLLSHNRKKEAVKIIFKAARSNRRKLSPKALKMLADQTGTVSTQTEKHVRGTTMAAKPRERSMCAQVLRSKTILYRLCVCSFWWVTVTMIYYGLSINSVSLAGNKYFNFTLTSVVEIPGCFLSFLTLDRFGRKSSIMASFFLCGISLLTLSFITNAKLTMILTLGGKMMISMIFCSIYIYTIELFPTKARQTLMGICSMTGRIGAMIAPQTPLLMRYMKSLPYLVFGAMAGTAGLLMLLTPETLHIKLPDTIEQAEHMVSPRTTERTDIVKDLHSKF